MIDRLRGRSNRGPSNDETPVAGIEVADLTAAVLERSSLLHSLRDHRGPFLAEDPVAGNLLGIEAGSAVGKAAGDGVHYLDRDGRQIPILDHPAQVARRTGEAQLNVLLGLLPRDGKEIWLPGDFIPLQRGPEGFSVLACCPTSPRSSGRVGRPRRAPARTVTCSIWPQRWPGERCRRRSWPGRCDPP